MSSIVIVRAFLLITVLGLLASPAADASSEDAQCLALAIYWEARGESDNGKRAIGWTILNRKAHEKFPNTVCGVVREGGETPPCQFSWWCDGKSDRPRSSKSWRVSLAIANALLDDPGTDPTNGALFFHATGMKVPWRIKRKRVARIGGHIFYR